jgi:hypothetical protein
LDAEKGYFTVQFGTSAGAAHQCLPAQELQARHYVVKLWRQAPWSDIDWRFNYHECAGLWTRWVRPGRSFNGELRVTGLPPVRPACGSTQRTAPRGLCSHRRTS